MQINSSNVLAQPDPQEVGTIASALFKIDHVPMTCDGFRGDNKFVVVNFLN